MLKVSSTIDYRWRVQSFPQDLSRNSFRDNSNSVSLCFGLSVYKWSPALSCIGVEEDDSSLADDLVETSERGHAYIKRFGVACSALRSTNHWYRLVPSISIILRAQNHPMALWQGDLSQSKVYEGPLSYVEGNPLTLCNHFILHYRALDTLFSEYY